MATCVCLTEEGKKWMNRAKDTTYLNKVNITMLPEIGAYLDEKWSGLSYGSTQPGREPIIILCVYTVLEYRNRDKKVRDEIDKAIIEIIGRKNFQDLIGKYSSYGKIPKKTKEAVIDRRKQEKNEKDLKLEDVENGIPPEDRKSRHIKAASFRIGRGLHNDVTNYKEYLEASNQKRFSVSTLYMAILIYSMEKNIPARKTNWGMGVFLEYTGINRKLFFKVFPYICDILLRNGS